MPEYKNSLAFKFFQKTKISLEAPLKREAIEGTYPFKRYESSFRIPLELFPPEFPETSLKEVLLRRRSRRRYSKEPLSLKEIEILASGATGITGREGPYFLRTYPSAGALYPIETYLLINNVHEIPQGIYHLDVLSWELVLIREGNFGYAFQEACLGQPMLSTCGVTFLWSAIFRRTLSKYGSRGLRYIFMDVAHLCENLLLTAEALSLSACPIGAFEDDKVNLLIGLDGEEESVIYLATVGKRK